MKSRYIALVAFAFVLGCGKSSDVTVVNNPVTPTTPTTPVSTQTVWKIANISIGGVRTPLSTKQAAFEMTLYNDGRYGDTDGYMGAWSTPSGDILVIDITNVPTPLSLKYKVTTKTTTRLSLSRDMGGVQIDLDYEAR